VSGWWLQRRFWAGSSTSPLGGVELVWHWRYRKCFNFGPTANAVIVTWRPNLLMHAFARLSAPFAASARRVSSKGPVQTVAES